jgi:DNA-binding YbaB/EbfC family protein
MTDLSDIMKQAKQMQEQFQSAQEELAAITVQGESGAGLVRVSMNGAHDVVNVQLDESIMDEEKEVVEDLLAAAVNDAVQKIEERNRDTLGGMASGFKMPEGFKFPF